MKKDVLSKFKSISTIIIFLIIFFLALILRLYNYENYPDAGFNWDEWAFAWCGENLLLSNKPVSWSAYEKIYRTYGYVAGFAPYPLGYTRFGFERKYLLVGPWLDHPWLFAVITGLAVILGNECSFSTIRLPAILMTSFCAGLIYLIGRKLYNQRIGILASLFFSFVPSIVIFNRQALAENGIIFFTLISFYLILKYFDNYRKKWLYFAAISSGLASLCKVSGIVSIVFIISILLYKKRYHDALISFIIGSLLFMIYPFTGIIYNWDVFYKIILEHSKRTIVLSNWLNLTVTGFIDQILKRIFLATGFIFDVYIIDWWVIFSWISILYLDKNFNEQNQFILLGIISNLAILLILIGTEYGWYMIPFYPFFCLANAYFINEFIKEPDLIKACIFIFTVFFGNIRWFLSSETINNSPFFFRIFFLIMVIPYVVKYFFPYKKIKTICIVTSIILLCILLVIFIMLTLNFKDIFSQFYNSRIPIIP